MNGCTLWQHELRQRTRKHTGRFPICLRTNIERQTIYKAMDNSESGSPYLDGFKSGNAWRRLPYLWPMHEHARTLRTWKYVCNLINNHLWNLLCHHLQSACEQWSLIALKHAPGLSTIATKIEMTSFPRSESPSSGQDLNWTLILLL